MKQVSAKKRNFGYKDISKYISIIFMHYLAIFAYMAIMLAFHTLSGAPFFDRIDTSNWALLYPATIGPGFSAIMHIYYASRGAVWWRGIMWLHTLAMLFLIPISVFAL